MVESGPHKFARLKRWRNRGRCLHCYLPESDHPVDGWTTARPLRDYLFVDPESPDRESDMAMLFAVNRAYNTGEVVLWHEGDPLPDPGGEVRGLIE